MSRDTTEYDIPIFRKLNGVTNEVSAARFDVTLFLSGETQSRKVQLLTVRIRLTARIPGDKCFIADEYMSI